jgi:hypothetical protein
MYWWSVVSLMHLRNPSSGIMSPCRSRRSIPCTLAYLRCSTTPPSACRGVVLHTGFHIEMGKHGRLSVTHTGVYVGRRGGCLIAVRLCCTARAELGDATWVVWWRSVVVCNCRTLCVSFPEHGKLTPPRLLQSILRCSRGCQS